MSTLEIIDLHVEVEGKSILKGVNLKMSSGEIHAIMGPNGTGKSTLAQAIMGHPAYKVTQGQVLLDGQNILELYPSEITGVTNAEFIRAAINAQREEGDSIGVMEFIQKLDEKMALLDMKEEMAERYLNEGFSGGEKKRNEILQMLMIEPKFAILDEIDSGLDIDALRLVANGIHSMERDDFGALIITHYQRLLDYIEPDFVHIMMDGRVVVTGDKALAVQLEADGYRGLAEELNLDLSQEEEL